MRRRAAILLLALGTVGGFGAGFASLAHHAHRRHMAYERHVASLCADAAERGEHAKDLEGRAGPPPHWRDYDDDEW